MGKPVLEAQESPPFEKPSIEQVEKQVSTAQTLSSSDLYLTFDVFVLSFTPRFQNRG